MKKVISALILASWPLFTQATGVSSQLHYRNDTSAYEIPYPDRLLQTAEATLWQSVTKTPTVLEGPAFDKAGNLYFTNVFDGKVMVADSQKVLHTVYESKDIYPCAVAVHKDGRLFIAGFFKNGKGGTLFSINPDGSDFKTILGADKGFEPNDMVFDKTGGLYFTDAQGDSGNRAGGVYYLSPDENTVTPVLKNLAGGNGIALSPDGKTLWVVEFSAGVLHRLMMQDATHIQPFGETVAYHFSSAAPDSMKADSDGNLYIAVHGQGRVVVLNRNGTAIGQIVIPGRDRGQYLRTANMAIRPGTREIYIMSSNDPELKTGSAIFVAEGFARAQKIFAEQ
ncbi:TPA: SMP-30/gluconolactonase/LRE family protein [Enterobacter hormaechei subsp. steigerwaltii]|nr:SMP-30/gluconolactonase/LRE family protein [Enterobacter hormaechei subsp. steigerwaltii]